ncbi:1-aminocyclopropane-1-carboxylate synthase-like protein 1 [Tolypocladium ophioglossoides CBS 100239]|uniref:1-aminocyclopropane-1-carboxylate synthase-like protein 1 n=1 Tax=Tolypocladium ophioglossoides (strain CBS 100239) TaxID=1163406 RepID=A0A0L0N8G8_TOLOC|nr:1-aminocyclopropane-1-carboxylate synthase-like protein 1 [Tolypocladium ophioglossoides CBS 100239]
MALSLRAEKLAAPGPNFLLTEVLPNLYDGAANPGGWVNLGVAENSLMHEALLAHLHAHLRVPGAALTYGDGCKRLRRAAARFLTRQLRPVTPVEAAHVLVSNGCTPAIENLAWAVANPGDGILIGRPYYGAFPADVSRRTGVDLIPLSFGARDPMGLEAVDEHEAAILAAKQRGQRIAALILAHPHNPLGRCYPRAVLVAYMRLCQRHQVHLICDEIYALSVFESRVDAAADAAAQPVPFESVLAIDPAGIVDPALVHVLWGMSKDFGANGLRLGFTVSQHSAAMRAALQGVFEFTWTSSLSDLVAAAILEDDAWVEAYIRENQRRLAEHHAKVVAWAREHAVEHAPGANAGFFVWVNLGAVYRRHHPDEEVADIDAVVMASLLEHRIFLADGVRFGAEQPGWFRIIFTLEAAYLEMGLQRIVAAIKGTSLQLPYETNGVKE